MADVGRPTDLNEELLGKIRVGILEGKTEMKIAEEQGILYDTWAHWKLRNYSNFADYIMQYDHERMLRKAEGNLDEAMDIDVENTGVTKKGDTFTFIDPKLWDVKAKVSMFVSETLGRKNYHKKSELDATGTFKTFSFVRGKTIIEHEKKENVEPTATGDTSGPIQGPTT